MNPFYRMPMSTITLWLLHLKRGSHLTKLLINSRPLLHAHLPLLDPRSNLQRNLASITMAHRKQEGRISRGWPSHSPPSSVLSSVVASSTTPVATSSSTARVSMDWLAHGSVSSRKMTGSKVSNAASVGRSCRRGNSSTSTGRHMFVGRDGPRSSGARTKRP